MAIEFNHPVWDEGEIWADETWTAHTGSPAPYYMPLDVSTPCVYIDGKHVAPGYDCPHDEPEDIDPGWTVQQR